MSYLKQTTLTRILRAFKAAGFLNPKATFKPDGTVELYAAEKAGLNVQNDWDK